MPQSLFLTRQYVWSRPDSRALRSYDRYCAWSLSHLPATLYRIVSHCVCYRSSHCLYLGLTRSAAPPPPTLTPEGNSVRQGSGGVTTGACNCRWPPALMRPSSPPPPSTPQPNWLHVQLISGSEHCFYVTSSYVRGTPTPCWITSNRLTLRLYIITSPGSHIPILFLSPRLFAGVTTCLGIGIVFSSPAEVCFFLLFHPS